MAVMFVGLMALLSGCSTCPTCERGVRPVGENVIGVARAPEVGPAYDLMTRGWNRQWPYGPNIASPMLW